MLSKRAFEKWYFDYLEAELEFHEATKTFEMKKRDVCLFLFNAYADWCRKRFGEVLRPEDLATGIEVEKTVDIFFEEFEVSFCFRGKATELLNQAFSERFGGASKNE
jgi:hypothetical protein